MVLKYNIINGLILLNVIFRFDVDLSDIILNFLYLEEIIIMVCLYGYIEK